MARLIEVTDITAPELDLFRSTDAQLRAKQHPGDAMFIA